ncbi:hypothetical protein BH09PLA1_BH09PLA1_25630 [soil metagenome]
MPETPNPKSREPLPPPTRVAACDLDYAELDVTSNFTFLRGASHPDELVYNAAELGYRAIAITDHHTLAGVVRAHAAAKSCGIKLLIGSRIPLIDGPELLVWATDRAAYGRLCRMLTLGKRRTEKGKCELSVDDFVVHSEGLLAAACGCATPGAIDCETVSDNRDALHYLRESLDDRLSLAISRVYGADDDSHLRHMIELSRVTHIPLLATNAVHYHDSGRRALQDVLTCVHHKCTIHDAGFKLFPNGERYLKSPEQMHRLFVDHPQAIRRGIEIAERCNFSLSELRYEYPDEVVPEGQTPLQYLTDLTWRGAGERYPNGIPEKVRTAIVHELGLIEKLHYEAYFLTVYDLVKFARSRDILCQGRGSAANSAVCYCIGVTSVDPARIDLLFERFVSAARNEPPDIDVDFEHERREEVIQYVYQKYGRDRSGMTATLITYRGRSAVRDVGKAMGMSVDMVDSLAKRLDWWHRGTLSPEQLKEAGIDPRDPTVQRVVALVAELLGFPRHLGQHTGGMIMCRGPLCEMVPIENASMEDRTVVEWDKDDIEELGLLKVDVLALGMLTCIGRAFRMLEKETERRIGEETKWKEIGDGDQNTSGTHCLAERDATCKGDLSDHSQNARGGAIRTHDADAKSSSFDSIKHRGGLRTTEPCRSTEVSTDVAGIAQRIGHTVRTCDRTSISSAEIDSDRSAQGNGSRFTRTDSQPGTQELNHSVSLSLRLSVSRPRLQLHTIPPNDPAVYDMICDADTIGVFQIESRAQMSMLPRLRPRTFYDLVIEVAIVRPGPIQGNMVHPYLRRRNGEEAVSYPSEALRGVLQKTLGVPLFQEQAMKVAMVAASFSADEADQLRRAMAAWRRSGAILGFHKKIIEGMIKNGYEREFAERTFEQIQGFGEYGFPESHSASFALLVYVSCWLKRHHPAVFCAALLNSQPMGFYAPAQIVRDAKEHGVTVLPVDVNESEWDCLLQRRGDGETKRRSEELRKDWGVDGPSVRLGFRQVKGFREEHAQQIVKARENRGFDSIEELQQRAGLPVNAIKCLAESDAFGSLGRTRRESSWDALNLKDDPTPLFTNTSSLRLSVSSSLLPPMPLGQEVMTDYSTTHLSLKKHPVALVRDILASQKILTAHEANNLPHGRWVKVAGLVLIRQRPGTASGIVFITLEDETGVVNLIVRPNTFDTYRAAARHAGLLQCDGYIERQGQVVHVMAKRMFDRSDLIRGFELSSRDFH